MLWFRMDSTKTDTTQTCNTNFRTVPNRRWLQAALQGMLRGSLYGMLYYLLMFLPLAAADQYYTFWRLPWYERILEFSRSACWGVGIGAFTGLPIGGALGVVVEVVWGGRTIQTERISD
jgi:hypothetical protein